MKVKINKLYDAIALVEWDGRAWSCTGTPYSDLHQSQKVRVHVMADFMIKVTETIKRMEIEGGDLSG